MAKTKSAFFCKNCGYESPKWLGKCPSCQTWNTFTEEVITPEQSTHKPSFSRTKRTNSPKILHDIKAEDLPRIVTPDNELNRVLGGGIVPGALMLLGGEPGIGKSTLLLQLAVQLTSVKTLYVSGEESEMQIKLRADRLGIATDQCYILAETSVEKLFQQIEQLEPQLLIIDSIQTLHSGKLEAAAGSVSQVKHCTGELMQFAKEENIPVFIIGHINKDGAIAGPKVLEHMVDTVLQFEGDRHLSYRIVRTLKNRFGSAAELGIYEMQANGLREVSNPSEILITQREEELSGVSIAASMEGNRPLLIEIQSLVAGATYGTPQRTSTGFDLKRLNMLLAVLEKRCGLRLNLMDVFLNIAGGLKIDDPATDLAICTSVASSYHDVAISAHSCFAAEVGLGGEIRAVNRIEGRITEAEKLGFKEIYISGYNKLAYTPNHIKVIRCSRIQEVFASIFG